jgi:hypothetical protein
MTSNVGVVRGDGRMEGGRPRLERIALGRVKR